MTTKQVLIQKLRGQLEDLNERKRTIEKEIEAYEHSWDQVAHEIDNTLDQLAELEDGTPNE